MAANNVRFIEDTRGTVAILEVVCLMHGNVARRLEQLLFELRVQAVQVHLKMVSDKLAIRLHLLELDGGTLSELRREQVQRELETVLCARAKRLPSVQPA